jgi:AcrR family transcriptional regulator
MSGRRDEVLTAALALVDERGLDALTMRALAERLGVTPMAVYRHVANKEALLDALVDRLIGTPTPPDPSAPWRDRLRALAAAGRAIAHAHPNAAPLLLRRPTRTSRAVAFVDAIYQALLASGLPVEAVPRIERLTSTFVLGYAVSEVGGRFAAGPDPRATRGDGQPGHRRLAAALAAPVDWDGEFRADVDDLISLVELLVARTSDDDSVAVGD